MMLPIINLNIDVNTLAASAWEKLLAVLGKDSGSGEMKAWLQEHTRNAFERAKQVQIIGMREPLPLSEIYQPTRLTLNPSTDSHTTDRYWPPHPTPYALVNDFLAKQRSAAIIAGPGWGKTTFLHAVFVYLLGSSTMLPLLFTLRKKGAIDDLDFFVSKSEQITNQSEEKRICLLVDGYDEVPTEDRKRVSDLLARFSARDIGIFYLSCRTHYVIIDLPVRHVGIGDFTRDDQIRFASAFFRAYGAATDSAQMVSDFEERNLSDLLKHPLLLALACISRSESNMHARTVLALIDTAVNTLSLRWDQSKGLQREDTTPLDGTARIKCLKLLAFRLGLEPSQQAPVVQIVREQLDRMRWENVDPLDVL